MDLDFTPEQDMLRDMVRGVCTSLASLDTVRTLEDDPTGYPVDFWKQLADLDLIGLMLPAKYGGSEMTALEGVVVYEELGRALAPSPHFVSGVMSAGVLVRAGTDAQRTDWLPRIVTGDAIVTPAWLEPRRGFGQPGVRLRARAQGDGYVLDGTKWHVAFARAATRLLVLARTDDGAVDAFLVDPDVEGIAMHQQPTVGSDAQYEIEFTEVAVPASSRVGEGGAGWRAWHETSLLGMILLGAQAMGGAQAALGVTVQYAKDRQQFDKPLGAFQAIAHYLSDASTTVDGGTILVHEAAWAAATGRAIDRLAPMAKLFACDTYRDVTAMAQQVFGGVGFTVEYDIQLYFRRAKQLQISWWDARYLEDLVAAAVLDVTDAPPVRH